MALNDATHLSLPEADDTTPHSPRSIRAVALVGVPTLTGTEAEIAEAEPIRERLLIAADDVLTELRGGEILTEEQADTAIRVPQPISAAQVQAAQRALNQLRHQTEANWWLLQQEATAEMLLKQYEDR